MSNYSYYIIPIFVRPSTKQDILRSIDKLCQNLEHQLSCAQEDAIRRTLWRASQFQIEQQGDRIHDVLVHIMRRQLEDLKKDIHNQLGGTDTQIKGETAVEDKMAVLSYLFRHLDNIIGEDKAATEIATAQVKRVHRLIDENRVTKLDINAETIEIENDFWSAGEYRHLKGELENLMAKLEGRYVDNLTTDLIYTIVRRCFEIEGWILQILMESVTKAFLSEERVVTSEDIINAMMQRGWTLKGQKEEKPEYNYLGGEVDNDWREGVFAVLKNHVGEEITIIVDPVSYSQNRLIIHQNQVFLSNPGFVSFVYWLRQELNDWEYVLGDNILFGSEHIPEMESSEQLGKAHAADIIRDRTKNTNQ